LCLRCTFSYIERITGCLIDYVICQETWSEPPLVSAALDLNICDAKQISHNIKVEISSVGCLTFSIDQDIFRY
jgi:hypothetical protein